jgi:hypothetical protein
MTERFCGVSALFDADNVNRPGVAPREDWMVISGDMILYTGQEIAEAAVDQPNPFVRRLGIILGAMAYRYTEMASHEVDNIIEFGPDIREQTDVISCSPIEYALAILTYSPLGEAIVNQYRRTAGEHNDPTCQRLLDHLLTVHVLSYQ